MICNAVIEGNYRYELQRIWQPNLEILSWVMLNPSVADAIKNDPTIRKIIGFSMNAGYGGIAVYNLFAYRATDPQELLTVSHPIGKRNDEFLLKTGKTVMAAWGRIPANAKRNLSQRELEVLLLLKDREWKCLGLTQDGFPKHPVRLAYKTPWEDLPTAKMAVEFKLQGEK